MTTSSQWQPTRWQRQLQPCTLTVLLNGTKYEWAVEYCGSTIRMGVEDDYATALKAADDIATAEADARGWTRVDTTLDDDEDMRTPGLYWVRTPEMSRDDARIPAELGADGMVIVLGRLKPYAESEIVEWGPPLRRSFKYRLPGDIVDEAVSVEVDVAMADSTLITYHPMSELEDVAHKGKAADVERVKQLKKNLSPED